MTDQRPAVPTQPPRSSFLRSMRIVAWGFLGIRKRSEYQQDLAQVNPFHIVLAGIVGALIAGWLFGGGINEAITVRTFLFSLIGAVILLAIVNLFTRGRAR